MSYRFACRDNDHACRWKASGTTEHELMERMAEHARTRHGVKQTTAMLAGFLRKGITRS